MTTAVRTAEANTSLDQFAGPVGHLARALFSIPMAVPGAMHLVAASSMVAAVPSWVPGGVFWVYFTGLALLAGAIGIHTKRFAAAAGLGIAALMGIFAFTVHLPMMADEATRQMAMVGFMKDLGLAGGALAIALLSRR
jgi:putative oxidoreductase